MITIAEYVMRWILAETGQPESSQGQLGVRGSAYRLSAEVTMLLGMGMAVASRSEGLRIVEETMAEPNGERGEVLAAVCAEQVESDVAPYPNATPWSALVSAMLDGFTDDWVQWTAIDYATAWESLNVWFVNGMAWALMHPKEFDEALTDHFERQQRSGSELQPVPIDLHAREQATWAENQDVYDDALSIIAAYEDEGRTLTRLA